MSGQGKGSAYFSVAYTVNIGQMRCIPQVCYRLSADLVPAVTKMSEDGLAKIYSEEQRFVSGAAYPVKKPPSAPQPSPQREVSSSAPSGTGEPREAKKSGRKGKTGGREFD
jgi:hypothetical protein